MQIVKELLVREGGGDTQSPDEPWCPEDQLPEETRCKLEGLKCMARWLLGLKKDELSAQKTFRMLNAFIVHKGDLLQVCDIDLIYLINFYALPWRYLYLLYLAHATKILYVVGETNRRKLLPRFEVGY